HARLPMDPDPVLRRTRGDRHGRDLPRRAAVGRTDLAVDARGGLRRRGRGPAAVRAGPGDRGHHHRQPRRRPRDGRLARRRGGPRPDGGTHRGGERPLDRGHTRRRPDVDGRRDRGPLMATVAPTRPRAGRNAEIGLLLLALVVGVWASAIVGLDLSGELPPALWRLLALLAGMTVVLHLALRWRAPDAAPVMLPLVIGLNGLGLAMIARIDVSLESRGLTAG